MSLTSRQYKPIIISLDLGTARTLVAQSLAKRINSLTVLTLSGGSLDIILNANTNDAIPASLGLELTGTPIDEIYWTNALQAGLTAKIYAVWID